VRVGRLAAVAFAYRCDRVSADVLLRNLPARRAGGRNWNLPGSVVVAARFPHPATTRASASRSCGRCSRLHSFWDALYATSGRRLDPGRARRCSRSDLNWDFMVLGIWLALPATARSRGVCAHGAARLHRPRARAARRVVLLTSSAVATRSRLTLDLPYSGRRRRRTARLVRFGRIRARCRRVRCVLTRCRGRRARGCARCGS